MFFKVITIAAVTVVIFVLAAQTPNSRRTSNASGIAIPLTKRSYTDARELDVTSHNAKIMRGPSGMDGSERNIGTPHPSAVERAGTGGGVSLSKESYGIWYATIAIGTPPQFFTVQLNTGTSDLFVPASNGDANCRSHHNLWDLSLSHWTNLNLNEGFTIEMGDNRISSGSQYLDNVTIGGFTADHQTIGAATRYSLNMGVSKFPPDGILGLALPSLSIFQGQSPLFLTLFLEGKLSQPVFSLKLTSSGGELYLGGTNEALYIHSTLVYAPLINPAGLWALKIDNIKVNGQIVLSDIPAAIDTGSNLILGDRRRVLSLHQAASGRQFKRGDSPYFTFPCRTFPSVTFTISGRAFVLPRRILNKGKVTINGKKCFSGIASVEANPDFWTIGSIFIQQFYTVYDFNSQSPRFGIAELVPSY